MNCIRCGGLLVKESVFDMEGSTQSVLMDRCLQCGNIEDPVSTRNRAKSPPPPPQTTNIKQTSEHPRPPLELAEG